MQRGFLSIFLIFEPTFLSEKKTFTTMDLLLKFSELKELPLENWPPPLSYCIFAGNFVFFLQNVDQKVLGKYTIKKGVKYQGAVPLKLSNTFKVI